MASCYFSPQPGTHNLPPAMTPPPEYLEYSDSELSLQLPRGEPNTPESLPSTLNEKPQRIQIIIPQNQESRPRTRRQSSSSLSGSDQMFPTCPRGERINNESAYLVSERGGQFQKKLGLYRQLASRMAEMQTVQTDKEARSLKKRFKELQKECCKIESQQKVAGLRLCELGIEIENNYAWNLAWIESCCPQPRPDTPLNATSPEFVPRRGYFSDWRELGTLEKVDETGEELGNSDDGNRSTGGVDQGSDMSPGTRASNTPGTDEEDQKQGRRKSMDWETQSPKERRLSLPCTPVEWV